jgi:superoxide dismutase, Fe-Mn family
VDKRTFIKTAFIGAAGVVALSFSSKIKAAGRKEKWNGVFSLPELPYAFGALAPFMDAETMRHHYFRIHGAYTDNLNCEVKKAGLTGKTVPELLKQISAYPASIRENGGAYLNHKLFWKSLAPAEGKVPSRDLSFALNRDFGSTEAFMQQFNEAAASVYGSGWTWLIYADGKLKITTTLHEDNPLMNTTALRGMPLLCLDVCDHAVALNKPIQSSDYLDTFWKVANWDFASRRYKLILQNKISL